MFFSNPKFFLKKEANIIEVKIKGVEVRSEEVSLEVNFQDLTLKGQKDN